MKPNATSNPAHGKPAHGKHPTTCPPTWQVHAVQQAAVGCHIQPALLPGRLHALAAAAAAGVAAARQRQAAHPLASAVRGRGRGVNLLLLNLLLLQAAVGGGMPHLSCLWVWQRTLQLEALGSCSCSSRPLGAFSGRWLRQPVG